MGTYGITQLRYKVIDYLQFGGGANGRIYIRNPRETFDWEVYTKPFKKESWVVVISFCLLVPFLMVIVMVECKSELIEVTIVGSTVIILR